MTNRQHTIRNQICQIEVPAHIDYNMLRDKVDHILHRLVYPKLGFICDKYSKVNIHHDIRSLKIDLGIVDLSNIVSVLAKIVPQKFEIALRDELAKLAIPKALGQDLADRVDSRSQQLTIELQTVKHFLNTGTLPWWNKDNKKSLTSILTNIATRNLNEAKQLLSSLNQKAWNRLIMQQDNYQLSVLTRNIFPELQYDANKLYQDLRKLICSISDNKLRHHYWSFIITFALSESRKKDIIIFVDELMTYLAFIVNKANYNQSIARIIQQVTTLDEQNPIHFSITSWANKAKGMARNHTLFQLFDEVNNVARNISTPTPEERSLLNQILKMSRIFTANPRTLDKNYESLMKVLIKFTNLLQKLFRDRDNKKRSSLYKRMFNLMKQVQTNLASSPTNSLSKKVEQEQKLQMYDVDNVFSPNSVVSDQTHYIENAGLILYWVYLKNLFFKLALLKENQTEFLNNGASIRAAQLLNLFVHGHTKKISEYELSLNKILCGRQVNLSIPNTLEVKYTEEQEVNILTSNLVSHWQALGKITSEGFRKAFVQRNASITQQEGQYIMVVERKPQDVLLNKLPWTINVIKLPWMTNHLIVEW